MPCGVYPRPSIQERFWTKVKKLDNGCWEWIGGLTAYGYGQFWDGEKGGVAHRFSYQQLVGSIPMDLTLDHLCRNRKCVNPVHLEPVTLKVNVLRGIGVTAINARVTHCPKGHPYDLFNTYITPRGERNCRRCHS